MIVMFQTRTAALARGQKIGMKLKSYNNQKNLTTATEKKKQLWRKNHPTIQPFFDTIKQNKKQEIMKKIINFGLTYLKKISYVLEKYIAFKYNSPKHCPISQTCLFCKKSCQTILPKWAKKTRKDSFLASYNNN